METGSQLSVVGMLATVSAMSALHFQQCANACRYQYLSFCHFLANGRYPPPYDQGREPALTNQKEWQDWEQYYANASSLLAQVSCYATNCIQHACLQVRTQISESFSSDRGQGMTIACINSLPQTM